MSCADVVLTGQINNNACSQHTNKTKIRIIKREREIERGKRETTMSCS